MTTSALSGPFIIAIDGGGTSCKASFFDSSNQQVLSNAITGPANVFSNYELAINNIVIASEKLLEQVNVNYGLSIQLNECYLSAGLAGAKTRLARENLSHWEHPFRDTLITTDVHIGCAGSNSLDDCFFIIVGTGSCFALYKERSLSQFGGHGFLLGDQASGAWLGKKALTWYLKSMDLGVSKCELLEMLTNLIGNDTAEIIDRYSAKNISNVAKLAPELIKLGDVSKQVNKWLDEGAEYIFNIIMAHANPVDTLCIAGGLSSVYKQKILENYGLKLQEPKHSPVFGAFLLANDKFIKDT